MSRIIIHRDIKPSAVMVTLHGDKAVVKVIDFGIAKATQGKLTDQTLFTKFRKFARRNKAGLRVSRRDLPRHGA